MKITSTLKRARIGLFLVFLLISVYPALAQELSPRDIVDKSEIAMRSDTSRATAEMTITTPDWTRTLRMNHWEIRLKKVFFIRILSPAKEAGVGTLKIGNNLWNYFPNVERTIKIPPSMMGQSWMGSDFTNDDLLKESSVDDYTWKLLAREDKEGFATYKVEGIPKPESAVVWGRLVEWVRRDNFLPLRTEFYDEKGRLIKVLTYSEFRDFGGRLVPARWLMTNLVKPGNTTEIRLLKAEFDVPLSSEIFTLRNLQKTK